MIDAGVAQRRIRQIHDFRASGDRARRHAPADELAEKDNVRRKAELLGRAAGCQPEHQAIVEDEQRAGFVRSLLYPVEEAGQGRHDHAGIHDRLQHDGGDILAMALQDVLERFGVVEFPQQRMPGDFALAVQPGFEIAVGAVIAPMGFQDQGASLVKPRASFTASMLASVPELVKTTRSAPSRCGRTSVSANSICACWVPSQAHPFGMARSTASITGR